MSVDTSTAIAALDFLPFRTGERGGGDGGDPVGTCAIDAQAVGDGSGGTVAVNITASRLQFGFHPLMVPTYVVARDNLAAAEVVQLAYSGVGNERLTGTSFLEHLLSLAGAGSVNSARFRESGLIIEPSVVTGAIVMTAKWITNTNAKIYHLHVYMNVWDAELMALSGRIQGVLTGVH